MCTLISEQLAELVDLDFIVYTTLSLGSYNMIRYSRDVSPRSARSAMPGLGMAPTPGKEQLQYSLDISELLEEELFSTCACVRSQQCWIPGVCKVQVSHRRFPGYL
jgi:hypothetical protein